MSEIVDATTHSPVLESGLDVAPVDGEASGLATTSMSPRQMAVRRYFKHKGAMVASIVMVTMIVIVLLTPFTTRYGLNEAIFAAEPGKPNSYLEPRSEAWFGTDIIGRDVYSRLIYGLRVSLIIGVSSAILASLVGVTVGSIAGLRGGRFDDALMRVTDIFLAFPFLVALLVVRNFLGELSFLEPIVGERTSIRFIILLFAIFGWMGVARLVRGSVLALKEREFVEASRALGASNTRVIFKHLLPNSIGPILVAATNAVVAAIIGEATLSFFGFGPDAGSGDTSLGLLVAEARGAVLAGYWWMIIFPCALLCLVALCVNFIGDGLRDATDPKLVQGG